MAAKLLQSLTDDNLDLQKQIGCMTGIFQLFDRQHMLTGSRRIVGHTPKRLPAGKSQFSHGNLERDSSNGQLRSASLEVYSNKNIQERQRVFTESSRASFSSSSRSSSFCSLDCNRTTQLEPTSFDGILFPETPSKDSAMSLQDTSPHFSRQAIDLRHLVKDSMYSEVQGSSVKAKSTESTDLVAKNRNSSWPLLKTGVGSHGVCPDKNPVTTADLKESLRFLAKLQEAPWYHNEPRELLRSASYHSKDGSSFSVSKDLPRFSHDGREMNREPDVSKSSLRLKDLPRLSLDSREGSLRSLKADSKSNIFVKTLQKDSSEFDRKTKSLQKSPGNQARPPSVVAKLMGLETLPDSVSSSDTNMGSRNYQNEDFANVARSFTNTDSSKPIQLLSSSSSKNLRKEPSSPRWRNPDPLMKPLPRFPIEPAPWKLQPDGAKISQKPAPRSTRGPTKTLNIVPTVYSEIEKRLKDLEFTQSGKDLRALKQILESMQAKGLLETEKEGQGSNFASHKDHEQKFSSSIHDSRLLNDRNSKTDQTLASTKKRVLGSGRNYESPIVIMKPAKLVEKSDIPAASVLSLNGFPGLLKHQDSNSVESRKGSSSSRTSNDSSAKSNQRENAVTSVNMKNDKTLKATQNSTSSQQLAKDNNASSGKSSGSISPKLQQKKAELEKRTRPPTTTSDSSKLRKQPNKQQTESVSPAGRRRPKNTNFQIIEEQPSEIRVEPRNLSYHGSENLVQLTNCTIQDSRSSDMFSSERSPSTCDRQYPSMKFCESMVSSLAEKRSVLILNDEETAELACAPMEYSSPVSVLDVTAHKDDSPSPVKYMGKTLKVDVSIDAEKSANIVQGSSMANCGLNSMEMGVTSEINRKKLQNIENLVQKLKRINSSHDEARTDYIASLCENTDPDHRYISEILLASGLLLRDLGGSLTNFQFHPSGHPINPDLFLVLEQTKARTLLKKERSNGGTTAQMMSIDKFHRKLIFDTVNEILTQRLALSESWPRTPKTARKAVNAQKLLRDLCSEVEGIRAETSKCGGADADDDGWKNICQDLILRSGSWTSFDDEIPGPVLDIERLIFKDLVNEIVIGESAGLKAKSGRRRNHLSM